MIKEEMDFEWHLISFCHGGVVHKQVAQLSVKKRSGKVREEVRGRQNRTFKRYKLFTTTLKK